MANPYYNDEPGDSSSGREHPRRHSFFFRLALFLLVLLFLAVASLAVYVIFVSPHEKIWFFGRTVDDMIDEMNHTGIYAPAEPETEEPETQEIWVSMDASGSGSEFPEESLTEEQTDNSDLTDRDARDRALEEASYLAAGYDYDRAIALLKKVPRSETSSKIQRAIASYEELRDACVPVDVTTVPHIFYHSLVNEPDIAFSAELQGESAAGGMNAWMTTVDEFDKITQQLYDNGYVYVRLKDLVTESVDLLGRVHFSPNDHLMLPEGKKAIVLSVDDLSYYHSYDSASFPDHLVLDDEGLVKCHYVFPDGTESVGDYDVVPRLNSFLAEHPDGAYHGARGMIAMTGYNGVFGYRTDADYEERKELQDDQIAWLKEHPDFDRGREIAEAKIIAQALKDEGWEFACHTWGHLSVTSHDVASLKADNDKWVKNVGNIVGKTDIIIFAHGNDIGSWQGYDKDNKKYQLYKNAGYHYFCNVDGSQPYWVQITDEYVRQGRINLDGYTLYRNLEGKSHVLDGMLDVEAIFDTRRPVPVVAQGEK